MLDFDDLPIEKQVPEALFKAATYEPLRPEPDIRASRLLYFCALVQHPGPRFSIPLNLTSRRLFVFERIEGMNNVCEDHSAYRKVGVRD